MSSEPSNQSATRTLTCVQIRSSHWRMLTAEDSVSVHCGDAKFFNRGPSPRPSLPGGVIGRRDMVAYAREGFAATGAGFFRAFAGHRNGRVGTRNALLP